MNENDKLFTMIALLVFLSILLVIIFSMGSTTYELDPDGNIIKRQKQFEKQ